MKREDKASLLEKLKGEAQRKPRVASGFAFGEGSPDAVLMIVGEAPGKREAELGKPFVGASGKLLDRLLARVGIDRGEVWITNVVKWRPTQEQGGRVLNRAPRAGEVAADSAWLGKEMEVIRPKVILCLGNLAASALIHKGFKMNEEHGKWYSGPLSSQAIATYHPAYVLRQVGEDRGRLIEQMEDDFLKVSRELDKARQDASE